MVHQNAHYLKLKGSTYYYTRRVPKVLQKYASVNRVEVCLHTKHESSALRQSRLLSAELEEQWAILRRKEATSCLLRCFGVEKVGAGSRQKQAFSGPRLSDALEYYLRIKGQDRPFTFETAARRSVSYLLVVSKDKPIDAFVRADANAFREYLRARGLSKDSIARNLTNIRAIINFVSKENGLQPNMAFNGVYLGELTNKLKRYVPKIQEIRKLQAFCRSTDDDLRWLLGLISDTGMRLSEAAGLIKADVDVTCEIPHVVIRPHPWRRLKTIDSERVIPLVGMSKWSAERAIKYSKSDFLFARYCDHELVKANSASAALNKWLKANVNEMVVVHSLRHAFRDRLRNTGCPSELIDQLGGWTNDNVGEKYGRGHDLSQRFNHLRKIELFSN